MTLSLAMRRAEALERKDAPATVVNLPFPPSVNTIWRHNRLTGKGYLSDRYKTWKRAADNLYLAQKRQCAPVKGAFKAVITLDLTHMGRRKDLDNLSKCVLDFLQRVELIENDNLCVGLELKWGKAAEGCRVRLTSFRLTPSGRRP